MGVLIAACFPTLFFSCSVLTHHTPNTLQSYSLGNRKAMSAIGSKSSALCVPGQWWIYIQSWTLSYPWILKRIMWHVTKMELSASLLINFPWDFLWCNIFMSELLGEQGLKYLSHVCGGIHKLWKGINSQFSSNAALIGCPYLCY